MTLEELKKYLERGKTVFFGKGEGNIMRLSLDKDYFRIEGNKLYDRLGRFWFDIEELYNEEDYKFLKRFGSITRVDVLNLPLERYMSDGKMLPFMDKIGRRLIFAKNLTTNEYEIKDVCAEKILFSTKDYIEVCKMCEKLFK